MGGSWYCRILNWIRKLMAEPLRLQILQALTTRVQEITVGHGFNTDAGLTVFLGETPQLGPEDPPAAVALVVGDEVPKYQGENVFIELPIGVQALARADLDQPWVTVEALIGDIKRAVELADRTLGGLVRRQIVRGPVVALEREPGSTTVGASVTYFAPYVEAWGNP